MGKQNSNSKKIHYLRTEVVVKGKTGVIAVRQVQSTASSPY